MQNCLVNFTVKFKFTDWLLKWLDKFGFVLLAGQLIEKSVDLFFELVDRKTVVIVSFFGRSELGEKRGSLVWVVGVRRRSFVFKWALSQVRGSRSVRKPEKLLWLCSNSNLRYHFIY